MGKVIELGGGQPPPLSPGDAVFVTAVRKHPTSGAPVIRFKQGYGIAVMLGAYQPHDPPPKPRDLLVMMGQLGYVLLDDIAELLGDDVVKQILAAHQAKYFGVVAEGPAETNGAPAPDNEPRCP